MQWVQKTLGVHILINARGQVLCPDIDLALYELFQNVLLSL